MSVSATAANPRLLLSAILSLSLFLLSASPRVGAAGNAPSTSPTPEALNHFLCREIKRPPIKQAGVSLQDVLGPSTVDVAQAKRLCLSASTQHQDPTAIADPSQLTSYRIRQTSGFTRRPGVRVANQFGEVVVDLVRPDRLLAPTAAQIGGPAQPLAAPIDHFKCYRVRGARFRRSGVLVQTHFGQVSVDLRRPLHLCAPANKNDESPTAPSHLDHLLCYRARTQPPPVQPVFTDDQFGADASDLLGVGELCVPSFMNPTCGDWAVDVQGEECDPPGSSPLCTASGTCRADCTCLSPTCGNGVVEGSEACDGGECADGLACNPDCTCPPSCNPTCAGFGKCTWDGSCEACSCSGTVEGDSSCVQQCFVQRCATSADCGPGKICARGTFCCDVCQGECQPSNNQCPLPPSCGDGVMDLPGEDCDGSDDSVCPGYCQADCRCAPPCGEVALYQCGGRCPAGYVCSAYIGPSFGGPCSCVPGTVPCSGNDDPRFPTCGGDCGGGRTCYPYRLTVDPLVDVGGCGCTVSNAGPCVTPGGACGSGAECPAGQACHFDLDGGTCGCQ